MLLEQGLQNIGLQKHNNLQKHRRRETNSLTSVCVIMSGDVCHVHKDESVTMTRQIRCNHMPSDKIENKQRH